MVRWVHRPDEANVHFPASAASLRVICSWYLSLIAGKYTFRMLSTVSSYQAGSSAAGACPRRTGPESRFA